MASFEGLGVFYLGRDYDAERRETRTTPFLYDSKDLTTHALLVGMTGSGKTGLGVVLLEEAAMDGIPALVIDPKGDMGNLLLRFPKLRPEDFAPWVDPAEATRDGSTRDALAARTAERWAEGLAEWGQPRRRLRELTSAAEVSIYTPGSSSGRPLALLRSFDAPSDAVLADPDALRERVMNVTSGLLGLIGLHADPVTSREHVLVANLLEAAWRAKESPSLAEVLRSIQEPPFSKLGVLDLESFFPAKDRFGLAARLNHLLASPAFEAWRRGDPLDVARMLHAGDGRPRHTVLSIAHLGDAERAFFVTLFLNEVVAWMRSQEGTGSLRALLYMDEIAGYFPPVEAPPSKAPMLTLLKQARAFGLGVVLSTQNPVDIDYRGLANIGTWFLGRLQTARDRERLLDGLSKASAGAGAIDRGRAEALLGSLPKRVFLARNVHEDAPALFQTRWAMSYLRGPLTLSQIKDLAGERRGPRAAPPVPAGSPGPEPPGTLDAAVETASRLRPVLPDGIEECFLAGAARRYRPALLASAELHYVRSRGEVDHWRRIDWLAPLRDGESRPSWGDGTKLDEPAIEDAPVEGAGFAPLPGAAAQPRRHAQWKKSFLSFLYREHPLALYRCKELKADSQPGESEGEFKARLTHLLRERRDEELERLRKKYAPKLARLQERIRKAEARLDRESSQYGSSKMSAAVQFGATLAGALFGRKLASVTNVRRAGTAARSASRASRERADVARAREELRVQKERLRELEDELREKTEALSGALRTDELVIEPSPVRLRKSDTNVERFALAWVPEKP